MPNTNLFCCKTHLLNCNSSYPVPSPKLRQQLPHYYLQLTLQQFVPRLIMVHTCRRAIDQWSSVEMGLVGMGTVQNKMCSDNERPQVTKWWNGFRKTVSGGGEIRSMIAHRNVILTCAWRKLLSNSWMAIQGHQVR